MLITSRDNPLIKETAALLKDKKLRKESGLFVAEGARLCSEAARSGAFVLRVFLTESARKTYAGYLSDLCDAAEEVYTVSDSVAEKLSDTKTPQGVFAVCRFAEKPVSFGEEGLFVLLSELQDPGNLGTILRTCEAMAVRGVLLCGCVDPFSPKALRSSMGCLFRLPVKVFSTTAEALSLLREHGVTAYASALSTTAESLPSVCFSPRSAVLIGNEGNGLSAETIAACDHTVMIPMPGEAESLNAASAAAILIYSASQQR